MLHACMHPATVRPRAELHGSGKPCTSVCVCTGHIGLAVPDVYAACKRFEELGVEFVKKPDAGSMKGLAFIKDPGLPRLRAACLCPWMMRNTCCSWTASTLHLLLHGTTLCSWFICLRRWLLDRNPEPQGLPLARVRPRGPMNGKWMYRSWCTVLTSCERQTEEARTDV